MNQKSNNYQQFLEQLQFFKELNIANNDIFGNEYIKASDEHYKFSATSILYKYNSTKIDIKRTILIVPSIFNSPEILFINKNFIEYLREVSSIYLIDWQEIQSFNYNLDSYVIEISKIIKYLNNHHKCKIDLIGHCIGGTLGLVAANLNTKLLNSITLLNTPWDFSYLQTQRNIHKQLNLDQIIAHLDYVPKIYQQIMFFLLNPMYFQQKMAKFFKIMPQNKKQIDIFFKIEHWLLSGNSLTKATYQQLTEQLIDNNITYLNTWFIEGKKVSNLKIKLPVCIVTAEKDTLAPSCATLPLLKIIKSSTLIEVKNGHISYLISKKLDNFLEKFKIWFEKCN